MKTKISTCFLCLMTLLVFGGCSLKTPSCPDHNIVILFDNDVHCQVQGYAPLCALRQQWLTQTPYVSVVSAGDFIQGSAMGSLSQGAYLVDIMNAVPYDVVTVGNHEFDYGIDQLSRLSQRLSADVVCCNCTDLSTQQDLFPAYTMRTYGDVQVAYIGIATPTTFTSSTPTIFMDEHGEFSYTFYANGVFERIQRAVLQARREGADYVIALSHLGDDTELDNSMDMIAATYGIDAVLDGHQHHLLHQRVANAKGDSVLLASTCTAFQYIGQCIIDTTGTLSISLLPTASLTTREAAVDSLIDDIETQLSAITSEVVGTTSFPLVDIVQGQRAVRRMETNLSDFLTDAFRAASQADICIMNGGGIRKSIAQGDITFGEIFAILPFNNTMHRVLCTGQQVWDALEMGVAIAPEESGDFLHVSGLRYRYRIDLPSPVVKDENGMLARVEGARRVQSVEIARDGVWQPLLPTDTCTVGGQSYIIVNKGGGGALRYLRELPCTHISDVEAVVTYLRSLGTLPAAQYAQPQGRIEVIR